MKSFYVKRDGILRPIPTQQRLDKKRNDIRLWKAQLEDLQKAEREKAEKLAQAALLKKEQTRVANERVRIRIERARIAGARAKLEREFQITEAELRILAGEVTMMDLS